MFQNIQQSALVALILLVAIFAAGCSGGADIGTTTTTPATEMVELTPPPPTTPSPSPDPEPVGSVRLSVDPSHSVFAKAERILFYLTDSALNAEFEANRVMYGPTDLEIASLSVAPGEDPWTTWADIPVRHYQGELLLLGDDGRPVGRQRISIEIHDGETILIDRPNWAPFNQTWVVEERPIGWIPTGETPAYIPSSTTPQDVSSANPLISAGYASLVMVDRLGESINYVNQHGVVDWSTGYQPDWLADVHGFTTMYPWGTTGYQYFDRTPRQGLARLGVPFQSWTVEFHGLDVVALDGASDRIAALYRSTSNQYRVRIMTVDPCIIEADFDVEGMGRPTCLEFEPDLDGIWVGSAAGYALRFNFDGNWPYGIVVQGNNFSSMTMVDNRHLAIADSTAGLVRFVDTRLESRIYVPLSVVGVQQVVSCEGDSRLAVITGEEGRQYLKYFDRTR